MTSPFVLPRFHAFDSSGAPLAGGKLYTYVNETTTPAVTYRDAAATESNPNPVVLDTRGEATLFLAADELYTFVLNDESDAQVWVMDGISGGASSIDFRALQEGLGSSNGSFQQDGSGSVRRTMLAKTREWVTPEDFGATGNDATKDSTAWQAAIDSGAHEIRGKGGRTYLVEGLSINRALIFTGTFTFKKPSTAGSILTISTGPYKLAFDGITFDGSWSTGYGDPDVAFNASANGLQVSFRHCSFNNWSKYSIFTGYPGHGKIDHVLLQECTTNGIGAFKAQAQSETTAAIINVNYAGRLDLLNCSFPGDSTFDLGNGTAAGLIRAPAFAVLCTYCRVTVRDCTFLGSSGIVLYTGCDYSLIENCQFDGCLHAVSAQECILPTVRNSTFIGGKAQYRGTITIQPWARLASTVGRKVEGLIGALIEGCVFSGNEIDIAALGAWLYAGQYGVQNTRCRGVRIRNCISKDSVQRPFLGQDVDDIEFRDFQIYSPCQSTTVGNARKIFLLTSTASNGHGTVLIEGGIVSSEGGNADQIVQSINMTTASTTMRLRVRKMKIAGFEGSAVPLVYARYADLVQFSENEFSHATPPAIPFKALDNREVEIVNNFGLSYPANGMEITDTTISVLRSDHRQNSRRSQFFSSAVPLNTNMSIGSIAEVPSPVAGGFEKRIYTSTGWKNASTISS